MSARLNRRIGVELDGLVVRGVLNAEQARQIGARYPTDRWDVVVLVRWFSILGGVSAGVGALLLAEELVKGLRLAEAGLAVATAGFILLARWLRGSRGLTKTAAALEMMAGFALQGLVTVLAVDFSTGSDNWPALVGIQTALLTGMAYALRNRLLLIHASVCFFIFFGGETGYMSGWGVYWLSMTYPTRFIAAGLGFLAIAVAHARFLRGALQSFSRVYGHLGLLVIHLALWFLSLFGYFSGRFDWDGTTWHRIAFSALWAAVSVGCLFLAGTLGQRMLRGYGLTFLIIDVYTFYFQFVVVRSPGAWWVHLLLTGASLVGLGLWLERRFKAGAGRAPTDPPPEG